MPVSTNPYRNRAFSLLLSRLRENLSWEQDEAVDYTIRKNRNLPAKPLNSLPYVGLYGKDLPISTYHRYASDTLSSLRNSLTDEDIDDLLRILVNQPPRPEDSLPFYGLFGQDKKTKNSNSILLPVDYYSQRLSHVDPWRICNSASHAMLYSYLMKVKTSAESYYLNHIKPYGNTTDWGVQTAALERLGVRGSRFITSGDYDLLDANLFAGYPVPIGVLHNGTLDNPTGGHVLLIIGKKDSDTYIVNDPWGKPFGHNYNEDYDGAGVEISKVSLNARWKYPNAKPNSGWMRTFI